MPLYEYTCRECEHSFEALVSEGEEVECPECHSDRLERHWSLPARPRTTSQPLPLNCPPDLPPCGPGCCRL
ncbi:MAG: zinc ribbon domain-containing protein [Gemmataceae bacterium]|nr:zinc ribbon domain-containing protein [Gemmataceae bacterium]MDW8266754.1 zinc ribbon domain-containing protein [Gemmataceae bacterium]